MRWMQPLVIEGEVRISNGRPTWGRRARRLAFLTLDLPCCPYQDLPGGPLRQRFASPPWSRNGQQASDIRTVGNRSLHTGRNQEADRQGEGWPY